MLFNSPNATTILASISGIATHVLFYRHGEWDIKAPQLVISYLVLLLVAIVLERMELYGPDAGVPHHWAVKVVGHHVLGIYGSMLFYRAFLHRLSQFPGPVLARLSNFYVSALSARKLHLYEEVEKLHKQYGDYVRLG